MIFGSMMNQRNKYRGAALSVLVVFCLFAPDLDSLSSGGVRTLSAAGDRQLQSIKCNSYVRLDYSEKDIQTDKDGHRFINKEIIPGTFVTIEAIAKTDTKRFSPSRLNVYDTTGQSNGRCDKDLEDLSWEENSVQTFSPKEINKVLIIQETKGTCGHNRPTYNEPNDDGGGGVIRLSFSKPLTVQGRLFVVDQDDDLRATELFINGKSQGYIGGASDSEVSVFHLPLDQTKDAIEGVTTIEYHLEGSGGIGPLDFCEDALIPPTPSPTQAPTQFPTPAPTPDPTPAPTSAPTEAPVPAPVPALVPAPVLAPSDPPVPAPDPRAPSIPGGVNGDPLIMGLAGQLFKFEGRSGAWYSAIGSNTFQFNMRITEFETCPTDSDKFVTAAAFSVGGHAIEVNVVNEYATDIGCGDDIKQNCLGAGSLELVIDGTKTLFGGDYKLSDETRVLAFNTFYQCSRKYYDFDVQDAALSEHRGLRKTAIPGVFDVISGLKDTMIGKAECDKWIQDRMAYGDLFEQSGHYSTIIIQTDDISFHVEYKQEHERCSAHNLDVWISSISPALLEQEWTGILGETRTPPPEKKDIYNRNEVLKFADDEAYEVLSPWSNNCKACGS